MRLRCWYEVLIGTAKGGRIVLPEERLRGGDERTTSKANGCWRKVQGKGAGELVAVREFRMGMARAMARSWAAEPVNDFETVTIAIY